MDACALWSTVSDVLAWVTSWRSSLASDSHRAPEQIARKVSKAESQGHSIRRLTIAVEEMVLLQSSSTQGNGSHGIHVADGKLLTLLDGAERTGNYMSLLNEQDGVGIARMIDGACHEVDKLAVRLLRVGKADLHGVRLDLGTGKSARESFHRKAPTITYREKQLPCDMKSHVGLGSGANALRSHVDDVGMVHVRMVVEMILEQAENIGDFGGQILLVLPKQNTVECQMVVGDIGELAQNLAFILVKDLPGLGLAVLSNVNLTL
jgi:hypothetical protein